MKVQKSIKKESKMPIKKGEIYLFIGFEAEKFSPKMLSRKDRRKLKKYPNLVNSNSFKLSRYLKFKAKKRGKICLSHKENIAVLAISKFIYPKFLYTGPLLGLIEHSFGPFHTNSHYWEPAHVRLHSPTKNVFMIIV